MELSKRMLREHYNAGLFLRRACGITVEKTSSIQGKKKSAVLPLGKLRVRMTAKNKDVNEKLQCGDDGFGEGASARGAAYVAGEGLAFGVDLFERGLDLVGGFGLVDV